jgi:pimeloyl-ACP methyl ester carboxylesterase
VRVVAGDVELEVAVRGDGPAVLLLHGWPDDHHLWDAQVDALVAAGYRTIALDLRGFGASSRPDGVESYRLTRLAADALAVLDVLGVKRAHVVGHDWGASLSWVIAALQSTRVDHLITLSVGHPTSFGTAGPEQRERSWYMLLFLFEDIAEQWLSGDDWANFRTWSGHPDPDHVVEALSRPGALTASLNLYRANVPARRLVEPPITLPPIQAPAMGVWSSGDRHLTEAQILSSGAHMAAPFRYERIEGAGHWMMRDAPEQTNELLLDFLPHP